MTRRRTHASVVIVNTLLNVVGGDMGIAARARISLTDDIIGCWPAVKWGVATGWPRRKVWVYGTYAKMNCAEHGNLSSLAHRHMGWIADVEVDWQGRRRRSSYPENRQSQKPCPTTGSRRLGKPTTGRRTPVTWSIWEGRPLILIGKGVVAINTTPQSTAPTTRAEALRQRIKRTQEILAYLNGPTLTGTICDGKPDAPKGCTSGLAGGVGRRAHRKVDNAPHSYLTHPRHLQSLRGGLDDCRSGGSRVGRATDR